MKVAIILIVIAVAIHEGAAVKCYHCGSFKDNQGSGLSLDRALMDPDAPLCDTSKNQWIQKDCPQTEECGKLIIGRTELRGCGNYFPCAAFNDLHYKNLTFQCNVCAGNLCNTSPALSVTLPVILTTALTYLLTRLFNVAY